MKKILNTLLFVPFGLFGQTFEIGDSVILKNWESSVGVIKDIRSHKSNKNFKVKINNDSGVFNRWASYSSITPFRSEEKEASNDSNETRKVENYPNLIGTLSECNPKSYSSEFNNLLDKNQLKCNDSVDFKNVIIKNGDILIEGFSKNKPVLFEYDDVVDFFKFSDLVNIPDSGFVSWIQENHPDIMFNGYLNIKAASEINNLWIYNYSWAKNINIQKLDGIEYFTGLDSLTISNLNLLRLPKIPEKIKYFNCSSNNLSSIPELPQELEYFDCNSNNLSSLPELPKELEYFDCSSNDISSLPELPQELDYFDCSSNDISSLPGLPKALTYFDCGSNNISSLSDLPKGLISFDCDSNNLSSLPELSKKLKYLDCSYNKIKVMPKLPNSLINFDCSYNNINSLPELPYGINYFDCSSNNITNLANLPGGLKSFSGFYSNKFPHVESPVYKLFPTENTWALIKLNTVNGVVSQVHYSISSGFEGELSVNSSSLLGGREAIIGRFTIYPTPNMFNFILIDQIDGRTWKVQWNNEDDKRFIKRIY